MNEKIVKTAAGVGVWNLVLGIVTVVMGVTSGVLMIINGVRLMKSKNEVMF